MWYWHALSKTDPFKHKHSNSNDRYLYSLFCMCNQVKTQSWFSCIETVESSGSREWDYSTEMSSSDDWATSLPLTTPPRAVQLNGSMILPIVLTPVIRVFSERGSEFVWVSSLSLQLLPSPSANQQSPFHAFRLLLTSSPHSCFTASACLWIPHRFFSTPHFSSRVLNTRRSRL